MGPAGRLAPRYGASDSGPEGTGRSLRKSPGSQGPPKTPISSHVCQVGWWTQTRVPWDLECALMWRKGLHGCV